MSRSTLLVLTIAGMLAFGAFGWTIMTTPVGATTTGRGLSRATIRTLLANGRLRDAHEHSSNLTERSGRNAEAWLFRAITAERLGDRADARASWESLLSLARERTEVSAPEAHDWYHLGWAHKGLGNAGEARDAFRECVRLFETQRSTLYHYNLACYRCLAGDTRGALADLERSARAGERMDRRWVAADPDLAAIRTEPGYLEFVATPPPRLRTRGDRERPPGPRGGVD